MDNIVIYQFNIKISYHNQITNHAVSLKIIHRHPLVKWAQRKDRVFLEIQLQDIKN